MARLVYRRGSPTDDNLTPRPDTDLAAPPGKSPGLSVFTTLERAAMPGEKAQVIDLDLLESPLRDFPDDPTLEGGEDGHVAIAPATAAGEVDLALLRDWAATRKTGRTHRLTESLKRALVEVNVRRPR